MLGPVQTSTSNADTGRTGRAQASLKSVLPARVSLPRRASPAGYGIEPALFSRVCGNPAGRRQAPATRCARNRRDPTVRCAAWRLWTGDAGLSSLSPHRDWTFTRIAGYPPVPSAVGRSTRTSSRAPLALRSCLSLSCAPLTIPLPSASSSTPTSSATCCAPILCPGWTRRKSSGSHRAAPTSSTPT